MTKIYLIENCFKDPNKVYIGKTISSRYSPHKTTYGENIKYTIIDEVDSLKKEDWKSLECYWIEQFKHWGFNVLNKNKGGGGPSYLNEEQRKNLRVPKKNKENYSYPKTKSFIDSVTGSHKVHPESRNKNISKSLTGYKQSEDHINKRIKQLAGKSNIKNKKPKPAGFGKNLSEKLKGKKRNDITKPITQHDLNGILIKEFPSITNACELLFDDKSKNSNLTQCCQGKIKTAYGFIWKYKN